MQLSSLRFLRFLAGALFYVRQTPFHALESSKESKLSSHAEVSTRVSSSWFPHHAVNVMRRYLLPKKQVTATLLRHISKRWATAGITSFRMQSSKIRRTSSPCTSCEQHFFPAKILCHNKTVLIGNKVCNHAVEHTCSGCRAHHLLRRCLSNTEAL